MYEFIGLYLRTPCSFYSKKMVYVVTKLEAIPYFKIKEFIINFLLIVKDKFTRIMYVELCRIYMIMRNEVDFINVLGSAFMYSVRSPVKFIRNQIFFDFLVHCLRQLK